MCSNLHGKLLNKIFVKTAGIPRKTSKQTSKILLNMLYRKQTGMLLGLLVAFASYFANIGAESAGATDVFKSQNDQDTTSIELSSLTSHHHSTNTPRKLRKHAKATSTSVRKKLNSHKIRQRGRNENSRGSGKKRGRTSSSKNTKNIHFNAKKAREKHHHLGGGTSASRKGFGKKSKNKSSIAISFEPSGKHQLGSKRGGSSYKPPKSAEKKHLNRPLPGDHSRSKCILKGYNLFTCEFIRRTYAAGSNGNSESIEQDSEGQQYYRVVSNLTIREAGLVSMAGALDMVSSLTCYQNGSVSVHLSERIDKDSLEDLFPVKSLLVISADTFGPCKLGEALASSANFSADTRSAFQDGFLVIRSLTGTPQEGLIVGDTASYYSMFSEADIEIQRLNSTQISLLNASDGKAPQRHLMRTKTFSKTYNIANIFEVGTSLTVTDKSSLDVLKAKWGFTGLDLSIKFGAEFIFEAKLNMIIKGGTVPRANRKYDTLSVLLFGLPPVLKKVEDLLDLDLPEIKLGVFFEAPLFVDIETKISKTVGASAKLVFSSGRTEIEVFARGSWFDLDVGLDKVLDTSSSVTPSFHFIDEDPDEEFTAELNILLTFQPQVNLYAPLATASSAVNVELELRGLTGVPSLKGLGPSEIGNALVIGDCTSDHLIRFESDLRVNNAKVVGVVGFHIQTTVFGFSVDVDLKRDFHFELNKINVDKDVAKVCLFDKIELCLLDFGLVVACTTKNALPDFGGPLVPDALVFSDYGCFCGSAGNVGFGPSNKGAPVDATDECCQEHDQAWDNAPEDCDCSCISYDFECMALGTNPESSETVCSTTQDSCPAYCCEKDAEFAQCLRDAAQTQDNDRYYDFSDPPGCGQCGDAVWPPQIPRRQTCPSVCKDKHQKYDCPKTLVELQMSTMGYQPKHWCHQQSDGGSYDHVGKCFRELSPSPGDDGQQCCYSYVDTNGDGVADTWEDNCSGSYDEIAPFPWAPGVGEVTTATCDIFAATCNKVPSDFEITDPYNNEACRHCVRDVLPFCAKTCKKSPGFAEISYSDCGGFIPHPTYECNENCDGPFLGQPQKWSTESCGCGLASVGCFDSSDFPPPTRPDEDPPIDGDLECPSQSIVPSIAPSISPSVPRPKPSPPGPGPGPGPWPRPRWPPNQPGRTSKAYTDPHLQSYDGLSYDCQAAGTFTMAKSERLNFELQAQFRGIGDNTTWGTVTKGVAISEGELPIIQFMIPTQSGETSTDLLGCPLLMHIAGEFRLIEEEFFEEGGILIVVSSLVQVEMPSGISLYFIPRRSGTFGCYLEKLSLFVPESLGKESDVIGLYGSPNGRPFDDWIAPNGTVIALPTNREGLLFEEAYNYCISNWCIRNDSESLFTYEEGTSFTDFDMCSRPFFRPSGFDNPPQELLQLCGDDLVCLVDGLAGSDDDARYALTIQAELAAEESATSYLSMCPSAIVVGQEVKILMTLNITNQFNFDEDQVVSFAIYSISSIDGSILGEVLTVLGYKANNLIYTGNVTLASLTAGETFSFLAIPIFAIKGEDRNSDLSIIALDAVRSYSLESRLGSLSCTRSTAPVTGQDIVVFNDFNIFDNESMGNPNNILMVTNIVDFITNGIRSSGSTVWIDSSHSTYRYSARRLFEDTIQTAGYDILVNMDSYSLSIPPEVKVIILWLPTRPFSESDISTLKGFAAEGGRIVYLGEHGDYYGNFIDLENEFLQLMGAKMENIGQAVDCGYKTLPYQSLRDHQITEGMTDVSIACASVIVPGPEDFPLFYDSSLTKVLAGVARINTEENT